MLSKMRLILLASLMLALPGCTLFGGGRAVILAADAPCTELVPARWRAGVAHTPDPETAPPAPVANPVTAEDHKALYRWAIGEQKKWAAFGVSEAQRLEDANGRTIDTIEIIEGCEKRNAAAIRKASK